MTTNNQTKRAFVLDPTTLLKIDLNQEVIDGLQETYFRPIITFLSEPHYDGNKGVGFGSLDIANVRRVSTSINEIATRCFNKEGIIDWNLFAAEMRKEGMAGFDLGVIKKGIDKIFDTQEKMKPVHEQTKIREIIDLDSLQAIAREGKVVIELSNQDTIPEYIRRKVTNEAKLLFRGRVDTIEGIKKFFGDLVINRSDMSIIESGKKTNRPEGISNTAKELVKMGYSTTVVDADLPTLNAVSESKIKNQGVKKEGVPLFLIRQREVSTLPQGIKLKRSLAEFVKPPVSIREAPSAPLA